MERTIPLIKQAAGKAWPVSPQTRWTGYLLLGIVLGFLVLQAGSRLLSSQGSQPVANLAPDFAIPLFDGEQPFQLSAYRGQGVVINFWASWCHPCREEMSLLESSWQSYRDQGIIFVGVNVWETETDVTDFLNESEVTYLNGPDMGGEVAKLYNLQGVPTTIFIAPDGTVNHIILGLLTPESLGTAVEAIIPN